MISQKTEVIGEKRTKNGGGKKKADANLEIEEGAGLLHRKLVDQHLIGPRLRHQPRGQIDHVANDLEWGEHGRRIDTKGMRTNEKGRLDSE